jgi:thiol peroxidase
MAKLTLLGKEVTTPGELPSIGSKIKDFKLVGADLSDKTLADFPGKKVLNIFPSVETGTCSAAVRRFNQIASEHEDYTVLCISRDLPGAQARFCGAEGLENVINLSDFRYGSFGKDYELEILNGIFHGLLSRCVIIVDEDNKVIYTEQVKEVSEEPDYDKAVAAL